MPTLAASLLATAALAADPIVLNIVPDQGDGFYRLYWTGGHVPYEVYRSTDPATVVMATNRLGETVGMSWIDEPPVAGTYYYQLTSSCPTGCGAGEICCEESCCSLPNATPACGGSGVGCVVESCDPDYWNLNGIHADGCEFFCDTPTLTDFPDLLGTDENCDFVDGEVDNAIFVSKSGNDLDDGSLDLPKLTIQSAIDAAVAMGKRDVYVAAGLYVEKITVPADLGVYGGYRFDFFDRDLAFYETVIIGTAPTAGQPGAVNFLSVSGGGAGSSVLDGFTVFATEGQALGASSYGVYILQSDDTVTVRNNQIYGGYGADGALGTDGQFGVPGSPGTAGLDALDLLQSYGVSDHDCSPVNHSPGGLGAASICGTEGGDGGERVCPFYDGTQTAAPVASEGGQAGQNSGGLGGTAGQDVYHQMFSCEAFEVFGGGPESADGLDGLSGVDGIPGFGCNSPAGSVTGGLWNAVPPSPGGSGQHGGGGGGGGSGAGAWMHASCVTEYGGDNLGGTGGGGGAGGCGGTAGTGGAVPGGSFAVFVTYFVPPVSVVPAINNNIIYTGFGGAGGAGGRGGQGGEGGSGGNGGTANHVTILDPVFPTYPGGRGGDGGLGGHGGGGGGSCGGPAYGIYASNTGGANLTIWTLGNFILTSGAGGVGGRGGASNGLAGGDGLDGNHAATNF